MRILGVSGTVSFTRLKGINYNLQMQWRSWKHIIYLDPAFLRSKTCLCQRRMNWDWRLPHGFGYKTAHFVVILHSSVMMPVAASGQKLCMHQHMYTVIFWQALTPIHAQQDYTQTMTIHSQHTTSLHTLHNGAMAANDSSAFSALNPPPATLALEMKCLNCWMFMRVMCSTVTSASPCMHRVPLKAN